MRPGRQQDHREIRVGGADLAEQLDAFLARGGVGGEVHVLHYQVNRFLAQQGQALARRQRAQGPQFVQGEQHFERRRHRRIVVDHQNRGHGYLYRGKAHDEHRKAPGGRRTRPERIAAREGGDIEFQALRVAIAGEMPAAREAGP